MNKETNPNNLKIGDDVFIEQAWGDEAGNYHDELANIEDIKEPDLIELYNTVKFLAIHIHKKLNIDGYNILQNNFKAAGQVINHIHVHIIPRMVNDERFKLKIPRKQADEIDLDRILNLLKI